MENTNAYPRMNKWSLYFKEAYGLENRDKVVREFVDFWQNSAMDKIEIPGKCTLGGRVYGREGFRDGDPIFTSNIKCIERVERGSRHGQPHDFMCATTESGSKYYFYSDEYDAGMFMMIGDLIHTRGLRQKRYCYLPPQFRGSEFL